MLISLTQIRSIKRSRNLDIEIQTMPSLITLKILLKFDDQKLRLITQEAARVMKYFTHIL